MCLHVNQTVEDEEEDEETKANNQKEEKVNGNPEEENKVVERENWEEVIDVDVVIDVEEENLKNNYLVI